VHFTGARRDVSRVLAAFDVFALSSTTEGLPLVIPEAMAAALPIVSTSVGGIPDVIEEGKFGFLVPSGDAAALREKLLVLLNDRERAAWMGTLARSVALSRYSAGRMIKDYMELYSRVLNEGKAGLANVRAPSSKGHSWMAWRSRLSH
jgi:glycosyltransferase involved in cell wall biosynthesis